MKNIVLIDYENLRIKNIDPLFEHDFEIYVFYGQNQNTFADDLIQSTQKFGERVHWVKISRSGPNALDFHIAYFLGQLSSSENPPYFHIVSKDHGFDALIEYMGREKYRIDRVENIEDIPLLKTLKMAKTDPEGYIIEILSKEVRPSKLKSLINVVKAKMKIEDDSKALGLVKNLEKRKYLKIIKDTTVEYLQ